MADELRAMFTVGVVRSLGERVRAVEEKFPLERFVRDTVGDFGELGLLDRSRRVARGLWEGLGGRGASYEDKLGVLRRAIGAPKTTEMGRFTELPFLNFVGMYGVEEPELSLVTLREFTKHMTGEWDLRPFLIQHEALALRHVRRWAKDPDWRVRRLATEGLRPRLPWGVRLEKYVRDPSPVIAVLDMLRRDPHDNVRNSVANNLNDISKDHPDLAVATARRWKADGDAHTPRLVRHAMRTLVKRGHLSAIELLGFSTSTAVAMRKLHLENQRVTLGDGVGFSFELRCERAAEVIVDYVIHHCRARGRSSPKVFKMGRRSLAAGEWAPFEKRHAIVPLSTRRYYAGAHRVEVMVNGRVVGGADFELVV